MRLNQPAVAVEHYRAVLKLDPGNSEARSGLGNAYAIMGKHTEAIAEFEALKKADPENVTIYFSLIRSYLAMDKDDKAQEAVMKVLDLEPDNQIARSLLAKIYVKKDEIPEAIEQLKLLLDDNPKSTNAYGLGILYMDQGEYDKSISTYKQGVENFPNNFLMLCNLSVAYLMNEDYEGARDACSRALKIRSDGFIPNLCMINTLLSEGKFEEAERHLRDEASELNNTQKDCLLDLISFCDKNELAAKIAYHLGRSIAYANGKWFNRVLMEYDKIAKIVSPETSLYEVQADILIQAGGDDEAIDICKKAIDLSPESPHAYNRLAGIYQRKARIDEAEALYKKVLSIAPDNTLAHINLGMVLMSKGLINESVREFERVIELDPSSNICIQQSCMVICNKDRGQDGLCPETGRKSQEACPKKCFYHRYIRVDLFPGRGL